ncbi:hypothetical protein LPJ61_001149 [Coemansia biformis]|uniref:Uncharacterized protein n=1 Tax=Coemansia biformis TaxID=1286918 RepID=A0A9W7YHH3_9FUNG|nr:hypothetical protein LPJ61_001149 [Coemansia biformis]
MSPMADPRPETASCGYSTANFASVYATMTAFRSVIQSDIQEPEELSAVVLCTEETARLKALALCLLAAATGRRTKAGIAADQWPKLCSDIAAGTVFLLRGLQIPEVAADSLDAFVAQSPAVRVDVLYWLCEVALMDNPAIKAMVDREPSKGRQSLPDEAARPQPSQVRLQPFAEIVKQRYWLFGNKTRQLYLESLSQRGRGKLELLAQTPEEFARVADDLRTQRYSAPKELADRLVDEVVPFLEQQVKKRERVERALQRQAVALASVHIYETRTRKRQRVNYNVDEGIEAMDY